MVTNIVLLPSLIMTFDRGKYKTEEHPLIEQFDTDFYGESEDEEIDLDRIKIKNQHPAAE